MANPDFAMDMNTAYFKNGDICLLVVLAVVLVPLGFAKKIDFLGFTSAIGMFAMVSFGMFMTLRWVLLSLDICNRCN